MLIIGSLALNNWNKNRASKDIDLICTEQELIAFAKWNNQEPIETSLNKYKFILKYGIAIWRNGRWIKSFLNNTQVEMELAVPGSSAEAYLKLKYQGPGTYVCYGGKFGSDVRKKHYYASREILLSIKKSHLFYPKNWEKHVLDYNWLLGGLGGDKYSEITKLRQQETEERLGALKTPSLNKNKDEFFDDNVSNKTFVHDDIHKVMAHLDKPMYEYIKIDPNKVACSKEKFFALPAEQRIQCVLEEAYVIALERCIIPMLYEGKKYISNEAALKWALMRIGTTLCSGWFRQYCCDNYLAIISNANYSYVNKFMNAIDNKKIVRIHA